MPTIVALSTSNSSGNSNYPLYIAFIKACDIAAIAEAPAFDPVVHTNQIIANGALSPPMDNWQRPEIDTKIDAIKSLFNNTGEFMPNAVLLGENCAGHCPVIAAPTLINGQMVSINIPLPQQGQKKPLWILDGQHRIKGLATSLQSQNEIPVVLLLNGGSANYQGSTMAKIFAQVTTSATKLDPIHNEWLAFAFNLQPFTASSMEERSAMEVVIELCTKGLFSSNIQNKFQNKVQFIPNSENDVYMHNFKYSCISLKDIVKKHYHQSPLNPAIPTLTPSLLAREVASAFNALIALVRGPKEDTVFFGHSSHNQTIVQDAFLAGVCSYLRNHLPPPDWQTVLRNLAFDTTNWNFHTWVRGLGGENQKNSQTVIEKCFLDVFKNNSLGGLATNWVDLLKGNNASVEMKFSKISASGRRLTAQTVVSTLVRGNTVTVSMNAAKHIMFQKASINIAKLEILDANSPLSAVVRYPAGGFVVNNAMTFPLNLKVVMHFYGGHKSEIDVAINL